MANTLLKILRKCIKKAGVKDVRIHPQGFRRMPSLLLLLLLYASAGTNLLTAADWYTSAVNHQWHRVERAAFPPPTHSLPIKPRPRSGWNPQADPLEDWVLGCYISYWSGGRLSKTSDFRSCVSHYIHKYFMNIDITISLCQHVQA